MLQYLLGAVVLGFIATLAYALITGRVQARRDGCCCPSDPAHDLRMRNATDDNAYSAGADAPTRTSVPPLG
jgi:hypothetical protein